jgi:hypothetical protein
MMVAVAMRFNLDQTLLALADPTRRAILQAPVAGRGARHRSGAAVRDFP